MILSTLAVGSGWVFFVWGGEGLEGLQVEGGGGGGGGAHPASGDTHC